MKTIVSASLAGATLLGVAGSVAADTAVSDLERERFDDLCKVHG